MSNFSTISIGIPCFFSCANLLVSLATMARTTAVIDSGVRRNGIAITGTGTDCIVVAAPAEGEKQRYAGMHTVLGEAAGAAVYEAIREGIEIWRRDFEALLQNKVTADADPQ